MKQEEQTIEALMTNIVKDTSTPNAPLFMSSSDPEYYIRMALMAIVHHLELLEVTGHVGGGLMGNPQKSGYWKSKAKLLRAVVSRNYYHDGVCALCLRKIAVDGLGRPIKG